MRYLVALIGVLLYASASLTATDWRPVAEKAIKAIVQIVAGDKPNCSGTVIDKDRKLVLTDAHCFHDPLYADSLPATVEYRDPNTDLMVLKVPSLDRPVAIALAAKDPVVGQAVASYGHGYGWAKPMFRSAVISMVDTVIPDYRGGRGGPYVVVDAAFIGGQSGSPVINDIGEMVMIVQAADGYLGAGVGAETIEKRVGKYFTRKP